VRREVLIARAVAALTTGRQLATGVGEMSKAQPTMIIAAMRRGSGAPMSSAMTAQVGGQIIG